MKKIKVLSALAFCGIALASVASCGNSSEKTKVTVGVCGASNDYWKAVQYVLDNENANIDIDLVQFAAYNLPNDSLNAGEIDLNSFQHKAYLAKEIAANNYNITSIGDTLIAPLTLYSKKYSSLDALKAATTHFDTAVTEPQSNALKIAIPNDATNQARGIKLLEQAGLITVDASAGYNPDLSSITGYLYNIEVVPQAANTLVSTLDDYAGATINGTYANPANLKPSRDGLIIESNNSASDSENPYVNIIVARTADKDKEEFKTIVEAFHTSTVANYMLSKYNESYFPAFTYDTITGDELTNLVATIDQIEL